MLRTIATVAWCAASCTPYETGGIDRCLVTGTCGAVRPVNGGLELHAPYGLEMLYEGVLAPNPLTDHRALFEAKARSYRSRWPWLRSSHL